VFIGICNVDETSKHENYEGDNVDEARAGGCTFKKRKDI